MKTIRSLFVCLFITGSASAQTMFIDYSERTLENTGAIHIMEAKQTIETEEFNDIIQAKTKLIRIIENYRTAGYEVKATSVSTHPHGKGFHYHYQYILQQPAMMDEDRSEGVEPFEDQPKQERKRGVKDQGNANPSGGGVKMISPNTGLIKKKVDK